MPESYVVLTEELLDQATRAGTKAEAREKANEIASSALVGGKPIKVAVAKIVELGTVSVTWDVPGKTAGSKKAAKKTARKKPRQGVRPWTSEEEAELAKGLKEGLSHKEIGKKLKRTPKAVSLRASKLGLTSSSSQT